MSIVYLEIAHSPTAGYVHQNVFLRSDIVTKWGIEKVNVSLGVDKWIIRADGVQLTGDYASFQDAYDTLRNLTEGTTLEDHLN